jgi:hypothetical protein
MPKICDKLDLGVQVVLDTWLDLRTCVSIQKNVANAAQSAAHNVAAPGVLCRTEQACFREKLPPCHS